MKQARRILMGAVIAALLSGCTSLNTLSSATQPTDLFTLTPKSTFDSSLPFLKRQIVVEEPTATAAVSSDRVAVQPTPLQVKFLPGVRWVDNAPVIIQTLLIESYENSNKVDAVGRSAVRLRADYVIVTDLREFQAILAPGAGPDAPLTVHVRLSMKIVEEDRDRIIASRSFDEQMLAVSDDIEDVAQAFDTALGRVMRKSVEWSIRSMYRHSQEKPKETNF